MTIIYVLIGVLVVSALLWLAFSKKQDPEKAITYECPHCGELHCDCYRQGTAEPSDSD